MGKRYVCAMCMKEGKFEVYTNVYSRNIISYPHFEIVCEHCGYGFVLKNDENSETIKCHYKKHNMRNTEKWKMKKNVK